MSTAPQSDNPKSSSGISRYVGGGALRQVISGALGVGALALAAGSMPAKEFSFYINVIVAAQVVIAWTGLPFYPAIYHKLSYDAEAFRSTTRQALLWLIPAILLSIVSLTVIAERNTVSDFVWNSTMVVALLLAATLPAFALGTKQYGFYNAFELAPSVFLFALIAIVRPVNGQQLVALGAISFLAKSVVYLIWIRTVYMKTAEGNQFGFSEFMAGTKLGLTGAIQSTAFRQLFLSASIMLPSATSVIYEACWPIAEKILVVPQSLNALMFGQIRRNGIKRQKKVYLLALGLTMFTAIGVVGFVTVGEIYFLGESYHGVSKWILLISAIFVVQSLRIMTHTALNAVGWIRPVFIDGVILTSVILGQNWICTSLNLFSYVWVWIHLLTLAFSLAFLAIVTIRYWRMNELNDNNSSTS